MNDNKKSNVWLSVIVPIYNAEKYLDKCIKSIRSQSFNDFELLLIDDGSTDGSYKICQKYAELDNRVRVFRKENRGAYQTRLYGSAHAVGEHLLFIDADDYYVNNSVFRYLYDEALKTQCDVLQFRSYKKYNHLKYTEKARGGTKIVKGEAFLNDEYPRLLCSFWDKSSLGSNVAYKLYKKSLFENAPDYKTAERIFWGDDLIVNLHVLEKCNSIAYLPKPLYVYRQTSGGTKHFSKTTMLDLDKIKQMQLKFCKRRGVSEDDLITAILFHEIASWFYIYVREAMTELSDEELKTLICESLDLSTFKLCREYYLNRVGDKRAEVELIRQADANAYISAAKSYKKNTGVKEKLKSVAKKIYRTI